MTAWWVHLSFSQGASVILLALLLIVLLARIVGAFLRWRNEPSDTFVPQGPWDVIDYSQAIEAKREWLGDNFLLKNPVNRIGPKATP